MQSALAVRAATEADLDYIEPLLAANGLPTSDIADQLGALYVVETDDHPIGVGGLEVYDEVALLRSIAIEATYRGNGYGTAVCRHLLGIAHRMDVSTVYLLTTTAGPFFAELGFEHVDRTAVPEAIRQTREFSDLCPESAVCMYREVCAQDLAGVFAE